MRYTVDVMLYGNLYPCQLFATEMKSRYDCFDLLALFPLRIHPLILRRLFFRFRTLVKAKPAIGSSHGKICVIGSIMSLFASEGRLEYSSSKAALNHMVFNLAHELAKYRVNVNIVLPG